MIFTKGDILELRDADEIDGCWTYTVLREERRGGMDRIVVLDDLGEHVMLTKNTIINRLGISWTHKPSYTPLPEDLFTL